MKPTTEQSVFIEGAIEHLRTGNGVKTLDAAAGTGKSFCLVETIKRLPNIIILVPTHKAGAVLESRLEGIVEEPDIRTVTSFCKNYEGTREERLRYAMERAVLAKNSKRIKDIKKRTETLRKQGRLQEPVFTEGDGDFQPCVLIDESSMTTLEDIGTIEQMVNAVVAVGDSFQLPPVKAASWFDKQKPTWQLNRVMRQGEGSSILTLANLIRETSDSEKFNLRRYIHDHQDGDLKVLTKSQSVYAACAKPEFMILSHSNEAVDNSSYAVRKAIGLPHDKVVRDDLLYAASSWDDIKNKEEVEAVHDIPVLDHEGYGVVLMDSKRVTHHTLLNPARLLTHIGPDERKERLSNKGLVLRYDYARTIHSSQGSQWDRVVITGNFFAKNACDYNRLVYTAVTRAVSKLGIM